MVFSVHNFARALAILLAVSVACFVPTSDAAQGPKVGSFFSIAEKPAKLVLASPERGTDLSVQARPGKDWPAWFNQVRSTSLVRRDFAAAPYVYTRWASTFFRAASLVGTVELRI